LIFEAIGTANLLYAINTSSSGGYQPFSVGLTIFGNICIMGQVSGGHFNPAVTLGVLIAEGADKFLENLPYAIAIMIAQITGACAGCLSTMYSQYYLQGNENIS
jgi:glycerol uptake facilitator-like aquaporin